MLKANAASVPRSEKAIGRANCLATDAVGDLVRITADKVGVSYQVTKADPAGSTTVPAVGVIIKKLSATECFVQFHGPIKGLYSGLNPGDAYLLGTDGKPAAPGDANFPVAGGTVHLQQIGTAHGSDDLFLNPLDAIPGGSGSGGRYFKQALVGAINGINTTYGTTVPFVHGGVQTEKVYLNGVLLSEGVGCDYEAQESGGAGTGFDTIEMAFPLITGDQIVIDFTPDL